MHSTENLQPSPIAALSLKTLVDRALGHLRREEWEASLENLEHAIALAPNHVQLHEALGSVRFRLGHYADAAGAFAAALALAPGSAGLRAQLANARARAGQGPEPEAQSRVPPWRREAPKPRAAVPVSWGNATGDFGVLVFSDEKTEWMLGWWHWHYKRDNLLPVLFVDAGMSTRAARFCMERGTYLKLPALEPKGWFLKPYVLRTTPFKRTLYLDVDCEVRGCLSPFFEFNGFAIARNVESNSIAVRDPVNSGVIVYDHGNELVDRWCEGTSARWKHFHSDQDVLDQLEKSFVEIPPQLHWLRARGPNPDALVFHHCGQAGKRDILAAIRTLGLPLEWLP